MMGRWPSSLAIATGRRSVGGRRSISSAMDLISSIPDPSSSLSDSIASLLPSSSLSSALHLLESHAGLPLFAGIALSCIVARASTVPLLIMQQRQGALLSSVRPQLQFLAHLFAKDKDLPAHERVREFRRCSRLIRQKSGYSRLKSWPYIIVQTPLFLGLVFTLRRVLSVDPAMTEGGALWFTDLSTKDPTLVLPAIAVIATYVSLDFGLSRSTKTDRSASIVQKIIPWYQTGLILSFPLITQIPSGVFMYWIPSSLWTIAQGRILTSAPVRSWLGYSEKSAPIPIPVVLVPEPGSIAPLDSPNGDNPSPTPMHLIPHPSTPIRSTSSSSSS